MSPPLGTHGAGPVVVAAATVTNVCAFVALDPHQALFSASHVYELT